MTTRSDILEELHDEDVLSEADIVGRLGGDSRTVTSALQGLEDEGILDRHHVMGDATYYAVSDGVSRDELKQAAGRKGASEIAEEVMQESAHFGDPQNASPGKNDFWEDLY